MSKFFERCLCKQFSTFFEDILSKYQCGFRKEQSAKHCLLALIEKWKPSVDHGKAFGLLLTSLSKTFDCLPHSLFIAKLKVCVIHLFDLFFIIGKSDLANFTDDNTPYVTRDNISSVVKLLEEVACVIFQWFKDNEMKANADKCHVLLNTSNALIVTIDKVQIKKQSIEKITRNHHLQLFKI